MCVNKMGNLLGTAHVQVDKAPTSNPMPTRSKHILRTYTYSLLLLRAVIRYHAELLGVTTARSVLQPCYQEAAQCLYCQQSQVLHDGSKAA